MNQTNVPRGILTHTQPVLTRLTEALPEMTPEVAKAASHVLENPTEVGLSSIRELADAAGVKPNTYMRMARHLGFDGYEEFRKPFREALRRGQEDFPDRARWLQSMAQGGELQSLMSESAIAAIGNIEALYGNTQVDALKAAADAIVEARRTYVLGVGIAHSVAESFAYLADMALPSVSAIPRTGSTPVDSLLQAGERDVLLAMTFKPWRTEVVEAVNLAAEQGVTIIALSDSYAAPIMAPAAHRFLVPVDSPQFFTSVVALSAFMETLMSFVIADAPPQVVANIERFHARRHQHGIYMSEETP